MPEKDSGKDRTVDDKGSVSDKDSPKDKPAEPVAKDLDKEKPAEPAGKKDPVVDDKAAQKDV